MQKAFSFKHIKYLDMQDLLTNSAHALIFIQFHGENNSSKPARVRFQQILNMNISIFHFVPFRFRLGPPRGLNIMLYHTEFSPFQL